MKFTEEILDPLGWSQRSDDFIVGKDKFSDLEINPTPDLDQFYYFLNKTDRRLIKQFVLDQKPRVDYICQATLIRKGDKFTPRLAFSVRDKTKKIEEVTGKETNIKSNVNLHECHENFWKLVSFLQSLQNIEVPREKFSLVSKDESEIVAALSGRGTKSVVSIVRQLSVSPGVTLNAKDINELLNRRGKLKDFEDSLKADSSEEDWWQDFFENNKWIFGYGLNYQILKQEQAQAHLGGTRVDGSGGERSDYLLATAGQISFTVLVEIKTPATPILQGAREIRNGAWSLSKNFTDAVSQLQANIHMWDKQGSVNPENRERLEKRDVHTVQPKGILVIGLLSQLRDNRNKQETFEHFRKSIHGIDIITFDELFERAKFIVESE